MREDVLARKLEFQTILVELAQLRTSRFEDALRHHLRATARALRVGRASFWTMASSGDSIECELLYVAADASFTKGGELRRETYPAYFDALSTCKAIVAHDATVDERTREFAVGYFDVHGIGAMLDVPVWRDGVLAGVICSEHMGGARTWTLDEEDFARSVANLVALGLESSARARAEERYRLLARATREVVWEWDLVTDRVDWADRFEAQYGHRRSEAVDTGRWWLEQIHPGDRPRVRQALDEVFGSDREGWESEYRFRKADGSYATVIDRGFVSRDARGRAIRMTGTMQDVTQRRALEERLLVADRMASLGTLAAGVAHEINNPLSYVKGNIEHVLERLSKTPGADRDIIDALEDARTGADSVSAIVRDLKVFARGDDDAQSLVSLDTVVESAMAIAAHEVRRRARLVTRLGAPPPVRATEARLGQVVVNLIVNAAHAVRDRDGVVSITTGQGEDGRVFLEVEDNGVGMTPEVCAKIFDPFFTTKAVGEGTGLGLTISHSIVTALGGEIRVDSIPGEGTRFRILLPTPPVVTVAAPSSVPPSSGMQRRLRILVVDDDPAVRAVAKRVLMREHEVVLAGSADAAFGLLESTAVDVVLCDVMMPKISGLELHERLAQTHPSLAKRTVFITGGAFAEETRRRLERSAQPVVEKPFDAATLRSAIAAVAC